MVSPTKAEKQIREFELDLRTLEYMIGDDFEPKLETLTDVLEMHAQHGFAAPPFPPAVARHIAIRLGKRNGRPKYQFTLTRYEKFIEVALRMKTLIAKRQKMEKTNTRSNYSPTAFALKVAARQLKINPKTLENLLAKYYRRKKTRTKNPR